MERIFLLIIGAMIAVSCNDRKDETAKHLDANDVEISIPKYIPANKQLFDTIVALDSIYWDAYNKADVKAMIDFMTDDHEFYHDEISAIFTKEKNAENWIKFYNMDLGVVGETVKGTNEIYEILDYGALQISYQRFYDNRDPNWSKPARAVVLWKETPNGWLQSRVFSLH